MATATLETRPEVRREVAREPQTLLAHPFSLLHRLSTEMDRLFEDVGFRPRLGALARELPAGVWSPDIEVIERGGTLVVRAELPGMTKEQITVQVADGLLTLKGERKREETEKREGFYRSEFAYGTFLRAIPLPEGVDEARVEATFRDGILEVIVPVPVPPKKEARSIPVKTT